RPAAPRSRETPWRQKSSPWFGSSAPRLCSARKSLRETVCAELPTWVTPFAATTVPKSCDRQISRIQLAPGLRQFVPPDTDVCLDFPLKAKGSFHGLFRTFRRGSSDDAPHMNEVHGVERLAKLVF